MAIYFAGAGLHRGHWGLTQGRVSTGTALQFTMLAGHLMTYQAVKTSNNREGYSADNLKQESDPPPSLTREHKAEFPL